MYDISLDNFQGPMDLLLHLIKKKKMNILDIKLEIIIDEYLKYIKNCEKLNLNIASSYLVMSCELIEIKSKILLPNTEEKEEEDLKENLINRLVEYEKYKNILDVFKKLEKERSNYKTKSPSYIETDRSIARISGVSLNDLINSYEKFLERKEFDKPLNTKITRKEISVDSQIKNIREYLKDKKRINFMSLFKIRKKEYIIATFLAILEMSCKNEIKILQDDNFCNIICEVVE